MRQKLQLNVGVKMTRIIIASIFFFLSFNLLAQTTNQKNNYLQFELADSSTIIGTIVFENETVVQIKDISGDEIRINKSNILTQRNVVVEQQIIHPSDSSIVLENLIALSEQTDTTIVLFELSGGSVLIGTILSEDSTSITINLLSNIETTFNKNLIIKREIVSANIQKGQYWIDDPNRTRLFFAPTGRGLKSGKGYFSVYEIFFPMVAFGIGDYFTFAGGLSLVLPNQMFYIAPKITLYQNEKYAVSVGDFYVKFSNDSDYLNILYSVGTASFGKGAITIGVGLDTNSNDPILLIGGELRISRYAKLITENWFLANSDFNFVSLGLRFLGENLAADFAFVTPLREDYEISLIPWIGFAYNF